jgi:hypothetical protein
MPLPGIFLDVTFVGKLTSDPFLGYFQNGVGQRSRLCVESLD